jgi:hypothetical protein
MRTITPQQFEVYTLDELEPEARVKAIENVAKLLAGDWWDSFDIESVSETILYAFAGALMSPGWNKYGEGDFPGIDGVTLSGWDLDRGDSVAFDGVLTRDNAPCLPWVDEFAQVRLESAPRSGHTRVEVVVDDEDSDMTAAVRSMQEAVVNAMFTAKDYGRKQLEWLTSNERAGDDILANGREFTADGELYRG